MPGNACVAVIDIGKTNAKVALVDLDLLQEVDVRTVQNKVVHGPPYPHYDVENLWRFILDSLAALGAKRNVSALSVTTHGASAALIDQEGSLAAPVLDYEHDGPDTLHEAYDKVRPDFSETGSPRLPLGLNVGAQLFWQFEAFPEIADRTEKIVTYPQYWSGRLTGNFLNEATSLGCHTDLWCPRKRTFSSMVRKLGWLDRMADLRPASERIGQLKPALAERTGLEPDVPVYCGIHDSNASLYPHLLTRNEPFSVVSTGTWVIVMAIGGASPKLDPGRDTLVNVNALGDPVPSARFMGGREFGILKDGRMPGAREVNVDAVLDDAIMLFPSVEPRSGPFPGRPHSWSAPVETLSDGQVLVASSYYLALMTTVCLSLTGAGGPTLVEGPFARNKHFMDMLAAASGRPVEAGDASATGTSLGAALLADGRANRGLRALNDNDTPTKPDQRLVAYALAWLDAVGA